jgi:sugar phosphate isomerase/epimerase
MSPRAVSTWSLHRTLGRFVADDPVPEGDAGFRSSGPVDGVALLDLPELLAERGYDTVQICHFHIPHRGRGYLDELKGALTTHGITLDAVLVDAGDLVHAEHGDAHEAWIAGWLEDAALLGADRARVIVPSGWPTVAGGWPDLRPEPSCGWSPRTGWRCCRRRPRCTRCSRRPRARSAC